MVNPTLAAEVYDDREWG